MTVSETIINDIVCPDCRRPGIVTGKALHTSLRALDSFELTELSPGFRLVHAGGISVRCDCGGLAWSFGQTA